MKRNKKVLVFGNPWLRGDSLPLRIMPRLEKAFPEIEFKEFDAVEELADEGKNLVILDAAKGIRKVEVFEGVERFQTRKVYSMHDFDLAQHLKLLLKAGAVKSVKTIGVPPDLGEKQAFTQVKRVLTALF